MSPCPVYSIFGAGPSGIYTAYRLLTSGQLEPDARVVLYEWGNYEFPGENVQTRQPCGRICTHHYQSNKANSYIEVGGMRYIDYNPETKEGHRLVSAMVDRLECPKEDFLTTDDPLYYVRGRNYYKSNIESGVTVPPYNLEQEEKYYMDDGKKVNFTPDSLIGQVSDRITSGYTLNTRSQQCAFYRNGVLSDSFQSSVYPPGTITSNVGYWNIFYDQVGNEGFRYAADGNGYSSNVINWNAANAAIYNGEFSPGGAYKTLTHGYSSLFYRMFEECVKANATLADGIKRFTYVPNTRLHSIWTEVDGTIKFNIAEAGDPDLAVGGEKTTDFAFLCLPPNALKQVGDATRYAAMQGKVDFMNSSQVVNYLESVIEQPSYKIAMFFDTKWWESTDFPPHLDVSSEPGKKAFGPTITDLPLRQVYYFGDNAPSGAETGVYGILASYDDMRFTKFWQELEIPLADRRDVAISRDLQPMQTVKHATQSLVDMVRLELGKVHFGQTNKDGSGIPQPLETVLMNWGLNPFGAGYHAWAAHYDITDVMQRIRFPTWLAGQTDSVAVSNVFIAGSAFSNDQAWVEGAFATAESILQDRFGYTPFYNTEGYPLVCPCGERNEKKLGAKKEEKKQHHPLKE